MVIELDTTEVGTVVQAEGRGLAAFGLGDHTGLTASDVAVYQVASSGWRVLDTRMSDRDAHSTLGFIERRDDRFEVMQLGGGFQWFTFSTMDEAVQHLTRTLPFAEHRPEGQR